MSTLKFAALPALAVAVWMFITAGMIAQFSDFAAATAKLEKPVPAKAVKVAPLLTASR